jgi:hypothetical protein
MVGIVLAAIGLIPLVGVIGDSAIRWTNALLDQAPTAILSFVDAARYAISLVPSGTIGVTLAVLVWLGLDRVRSLTWSAWEEGDQLRLIQRQSPTSGFGLVVTAVILESVIAAIGISLATQGQLGGLEATAWTAYPAVVEGIVSFVFTGWVAGVILNWLAPGPPGVTSWMWGWLVFAPLTFVLAASIFAGIGLESFLAIGNAPTDATVGTDLLVRTGLTWVAMAFAWIVVGNWSRWSERFAQMEAESPPEPRVLRRPNQTAVWQLRTESAMHFAAGFALLALAAFQPKDPIFIAVYWMGGWWLALRALFEAPRDTRLDAFLTITGGLATAVSVLIFWNPFQWRLLP